MTQTKGTQIVSSVCQTDVVHRPLEGRIIHYTFCVEDARRSGVQRTFVTESAAYDLQATSHRIGSAHRGHCLYVSYVRGTTDKWHRYNDTTAVTTVNLKQFLDRRGVHLVLHQAARSGHRVTIAVRRRGLGATGHRGTRKKKSRHPTILLLCETQTGGGVH